MTETKAPRVLFLQHAVKDGGSARSMLQIIREYEREYGPQKVLFLRNGPAMRNYESLSSQVRSGHLLLPFHGSEVSGMTPAMALRNLLGLLAVPWAWLRYLRGHDVVYLNSSALCAYGAFTKLVSPRTRVICHIREPLSDTIWGRTIRALLRRGADRIIAISKNELANLDIPEVTGQVVYNYVHSSDYLPRKGQSLHRQDPAVGPEKFAVGYFARLDHKNGLGEFIKLARRYEGDPRMAFCIYGHTGDEGREVRETLLEAGDNVHVYPMVSDVPGNLGDLDALLVPFTAPHFARAAIEASMLRVPSVIYDIVSVNETVLDDRTGFVVPLMDIDAMGDRLDRLRDEPETYARLVSGGYDFAMENFSERNYQRIQDAIDAEVAQARSRDC